MIGAVLASESVPSTEAVAARYDGICLREELAGRGPAGLFREAERTLHADILNKWAEQLGGIAHGGRLRGQVLHFGQAFEDEDAREILPAITIELGAEGAQLPRQVELHGRTSVLVESAGLPRASVIFTAAASSAPRPCCAGSGRTVAGPGWPPRVDPAHPRRRSGDRRVPLCPFGHGARARIFGALGARPADWDAWSFRRAHRSSPLCPALRGRVPRPARRDFGWG